MKPSLSRSLPIVALVALGAVLFMGSGSPTLTGAEAKKLVKAGATLLDVRTPEEFSAGHIDGAINIPVQVLEARLKELDGKKDQDIVVYCRSGARSATARGLLQKAGFTKVHDLGGKGNWEQ